MRTWEIVGKDKGKHENNLSVKTKDGKEDSDQPCLVPQEDYGRKV